MPQTLVNPPLAATRLARAAEAGTPAGNDSVQWIPSPFIQFSATVETHATEESEWADLAAHARAGWAKDNPF